MNQDIKASVRLPKTNFSMKANLPELDAKILKAWQEIGIYKEIVKKHTGKPKFILHDGPPYANGHIHIGHALNKILKDIIVKAHSIQGLATPFVLGWDCHGLPIEWKIEEKYKKLGQAKEEIEVNAFRQECKEFADKWIAIQKEEFKELGIFADFDNSYFTTQPQVEATILEGIFQVLKQGGLYQGKRPVLWSCVEKTALAEAEVEYHDKKAITAFVGFKVAKAPKELWQNALLAIWTTTPWTLPANQAVAYGESISYILLEITEVSADSLLKKGTKLIIAEDLLATVLEKIGVSSYTLLDKQQGLPDFQLEHPLYSQGFKYIVPTLSANFVDTKTGTGLVHIAPAHGEDDFYLCKNNNIIPVEIISDAGLYISSVPLFAGQHIFKVAPLILEALSHEGTLLGTYEVTHSYPHSWRSKAPLIYRLTTQWFISLEHNNVRQKALKALENVDFYPKTGKNRLVAMLSNRPDWCISRQRSWGVPLSLFIHKETKTPLVDEELFNNIINAFAKEGSNAWFSGDNKRFLPAKYNKDDYLAISDVVDVWVDSGLSYNYVLQKRENMAFPADIYVEGSDQHRGWFQSSLIMSILLTGQAPYKKVMTHGFTMDESNQKMSKSLGNTTTPKQFSQQYGTDILRLWVASNDVAEDMKIGNNILKQQTEIYKKIRNTLRYLLANLSNYKTDVAYENLAEIDKYLLNKIYEIDQLFIKTFKDTLVLHQFFSRLFNFILADLSAFFFDVKKDTLYCDADNNPNFQGTLTVLNVLNEFMLKWLAPFIPFTMEEVYANRYNKNLGELFLHDFIVADKAWFNTMLATKWKKIQEVRKVVTGALEVERVAGVIGSSLEADPIVYVNADYKEILDSVNFAEICITSSITVELIDNMPKTEELFNLPEYSNIFVKFQKSSGQKCVRCWKFYEKLENNLCERCNSVVN